MDKWEYRMQRQQERWARRQEKWAQRQERWAARGERHKHGGLPGAVFGLIIVGIGLLFLLDNMGIVYYRDYLSYWPAILVVLGVARIADSCGPGGIIWGAMLAGVGGLLLVNNLGIFTVDWRMFWPLLVIGWGLLILLRNMERRRFAETAIPGQPPTNIGSAPPPPNCGRPSNPGLGGWAMFNEGVGAISDKAFKGTEVAAIFGGYKLDLRDAVMATDQAVVDVNAVFGGVEIRIPDTWTVDMRGIGVFGGFDDKTRPPRVDPNGKLQKLVITGYAVFGGAKVEN